MRVTEACAAVHKRRIGAVLMMEDGDGRVCGTVSRNGFRSREHARLSEETGFFEVLR